MDLELIRRALCNGALHAFFEFLRHTEADVNRRTLWFAPSSIACSSWRGSFRAEVLSAMEQSRQPGTLETPGSANPARAQAVRSPTPVLENASAVPPAADCVQTNPRTMDGACAPLESGSIANMRSASARRPIFATDLMSERTQSAASVVRGEEWRTLRRRKEEQRAGRAIALPTDCFIISSNRGCQIEPSAERPAGRTGRAPAATAQA
jgi:hypothetical protein